MNPGRTRSGPEGMVCFDDLGSIASDSTPLHLAIGMFDGVHLGHRAVIEPAVRAARAAGGRSGVLTFWPHPSALFRPDRPTKLIQDRATKCRVLGTLGVEFVVTESFTPEIAKIEAADFLPWLKAKLPNLDAVYVGENFRYGSGRLGDVDRLRESGAPVGVQVTSAPRVVLNGVPISSTRIRTDLEAGEIEAANSLLGYPYFATGIVRPGNRLGRSIGFPTLNLPWTPPLAPRFGVYRVRVSKDAAGEPSLPAVANYGVRPTVESRAEPRLEVHVLGKCPFGAGDAVRVDWLNFIRPERRFSGVGELRAQIARDRDAAAAQFGVAQEPNRT